MITPAARPVPKLELTIERFELACGAVLLVSRRAGAPVTAVHAHVRGGPAQDPPGLEGTAFLAGSLVDQGTRDFTEERIAEQLEPCGGELAGDASGIHGSIAGGEWKLLLRVMTSMLTKPTYPAEKVALHKQRLLDRLLVERDDPRAQGGLVFRKLVYGKHWLGRAAYGTLASVKKIELAHLRAHHSANGVAKRAVIAVCGDVDPKAVKRELDRLLARWKPGTSLATEPPRFPERGVRVDAFPAERQQVHLYLGHLGIARSHPDYAALVVMDHVLGTGPGFTNRIARILRDE
ncbi:MAG: insulinase family protein, partial [Planctomycetes bacterium]|nr:insulinase family protein [Planctomycetota bacterium]